MAARRLHLRRGQGIRRQLRKLVRSSFSSAGTCPGRRRSTARSMLRAVAPVRTVDVIDEALPPIAERPAARIIVRQTYRSIRHASPSREPGGGARRHSRARRASGRSIRVTDVSRRGGAGRTETRGSAAAGSDPNPRFNAACADAVSTSPLITASRVAAAPQPGPRCAQRSAAPSASRDRRWSPAGRLSPAKCGSADETSSGK